MKTLRIDDGSIIVWIHTLRAVVVEIRAGLELAEKHPPVGLEARANIGAMAAVPFVNRRIQQDGRLPSPPGRVAWERAKGELRRRADTLEAMAQQLEEIQTVQGCHVCGGSQQIRGVGSRGDYQPCPLCTEIGRKQYDEELAVLANGDGYGGD